MRRLAAAVLLAVVTGIAASSTPAIEPDVLLDHIKFLASDDMKGRADGSPELERAAEYIAQQFKSSGLQPGGENGTWFQPFELIAGLTVGTANKLSIEADGKKVSMTLGTSYYPLSAPANENVTAPSARVEHLPIVFAGYGLAVPSIGYDDYARIDVKDKAVLIFSHEPQEHDANS